MKIVILGAGAMGSLFGSYLSRNNEVYLVEINQEKVDRINRDGVTVREQDGYQHIFYPKAVKSTAGLGTADLVVVFVKAMYSEGALHTNSGLIGEHTHVMSLQNGAGHEDTLLKFMKRDQVILGTTQHNSSPLGTAAVYHGGGGATHIGLLDGGSESIRYIAEEMTACGFETEVTDEVKKLIWNKLFLNASASALTGILQTPLGFIEENPHAWNLAKQLISEAVEVANAQGMGFKPEEVTKEVRQVLVNARDGYTSIYMDLNHGSRTEVDTISGTVVRAARQYGVPAPAHEMAVELIHAMEDCGRS